MSWSGFLFVSTALMCIGCAIWAFLSAQAAAAGLASVRRRLSSVESQTQSIATSCESWKSATLELGESLKMMKVRRAMATRTSADGEPDATREPEQWRAWQNARIRLQRHP